MKEKLDLYIKKNLIKNSFPFKNILKRKTKKVEINEELECLEEKYAYCGSSINNINNFIQNNKNDNNFQKLLFNYIDNKNLKDSDVYNKVHIDRRLFSKIRSDSNYHPSRETILLLGFSLELTEEEIDKLLDSASYSLTKNNYYDLIIRFCFINHIYNLKDINDLLDSYKCKLFNY